MLVVFFSLFLFLVSPFALQNVYAGYSVAMSDPTTNRCGATSTLLHDGRVLVVGGATLVDLGGSFSTQLLDTAEIYDPVTNTWSEAARMGTPRTRHSALQLPNGKVLVIAGTTVAGVYAPPLLYDPLRNTWTPAADLPGVYTRVTLTLLQNGKVLLVGNGDTATASLYDPATDTWSSAGTPAMVRSNHTATLLPNGKVLIAGGYDTSISAALSASELYDPSSNTWTTVANMAHARSSHTATCLPNGKVLIQGGAANGIVSSAELYDYVTDSWSSAGTNPSSARNSTATLLPDGRVAIMGGADDTCETSYSPYLSVIMLYDPLFNSWIRDVDLLIQRSYHAATLLPDGTVFLTGNCDCLGGVHVRDTGELYCPANAGTWSAKGDLAAARRDHTATILPNGTTLVVGGNDNGTYLRSTEFYDPVIQAWGFSGDLSTPRSSHTATLLTDGRVLAAGGSDGNITLSSVESYTPDNGIWSQASEMVQGRKGHSATLLPNGDLLVVGGFNEATPLKSTEIYSPSTGSWKTHASLNVARAHHTATLLADGRILVAGGFAGANYLDSVELYDPVSKLWSIIDPLDRARAYHAATLASDGSVIISGGSDGAGAIATIEYFFYEYSAWAELETSVLTARTGHTATLLQDGSVLFAGGADGAGYPALADIYSPTTDVRYSAGSLINGRTGHTATLQPDGTVLLAGGYNAGGVLAATELFTPNSLQNSSPRPTVTGAELQSGQSNLNMTGSNLRGFSEGSSGASNSSSTALPMVQLKRIDNDLSFFLLPEPSQLWSENSFVSESLADLVLPAGYYQATLFAGAIPGISRFVSIDSAVSPVPALDITPSPVDFGAAATSTTKSVIISNNGNDDLVLSEISLDGQDAPRFAVSAADSCWSEIAPGATCQMDLTFTPDSTNPVAAILRVLSNDPYSENYELPLVSAGSIPQYTLTLSMAGPGTGSVSTEPTPPGIVCTSGCSQVFSDGTEVYLTAVANSGSVFAEWDGCDAYNDNVCFVFMAGDVSVTVEFSDLSVATTQLGDGYVNTAYSSVLSATGGTAPYTWSVVAGSLPSGLILNNSTGAITGTPSTAGTSTFTVQVSDVDDIMTTRQIPMSILAQPAVSTTTLAAGKTGTAYSQTLAATGGKAPYTWSLSAGALPAGLTLSGNGIISGTPIKIGTYSFTVQVADANSVTASKVLSITTTAGTLVISTTSLPAGYVGTTYSQALKASGGNAPFTWSISTGTLPTGLSLNAATGVISGTPTVVGSKTVKFLVRDASAKTASKTLTIVINAAVSVSTTTLAAGNVGSAYSQTITAAGGKTPYSWSIASGALPAGLSLAATTGVVSGTPTAIGTSSFTVQVKDANDATATKALSITINAAVLAVATTALPNGYVGVPYSQSLAATGGVAPYTWSVTTGVIPAGLTLSTSGAISGTPTTAVTNSSITFQVKDAVNVTATKVIPMTINPVLTVSTSTLAAGTVGTAYSQTVIASGGKTPYLWSLTSGTLPAGLSLNAETGTIAGTPTTTGSSSFTVQVMDANSTTAVKSLSLTVNPAALAVLTSSLPDGIMDVPYLQKLSATGGTAPYTWSIASGSLPSGLFLKTTTGEIHGYPEVIGTSSFSIRVTDATSATATKTLSLKIHELPSITPYSNPNGTVGTPYSATLAVSGSYPPYTWTIPNESLPPGLAFDVSTTTVSGTPTLAAAYRFIIRLKDVNNVIYDIPSWIIIEPVLSVSTDRLPNGYVGSQYLQVLSAGGGVAPYTWAVTGGTLPAGLQLTSSSYNTGMISGMPTAAGTKTMQFQVTDSTGKTAYRVLSLEIYTAPVIDAITLPDGSVGTAYTQNITATGGKTPLTWSLASGALPAGLVLDSFTGSISGTPTATGTSSFAITVSDTSGRTDTEAFTITIAPAIARIQVSPSSLSFGDIISGKAAIMTLTVSNVSQSDLALGLVSPPAVPFNFVSDTCSNQNMAPGAACTVVVQFAPVHQGDFSDTINIPSNDAYYPTIPVMLSGHAVFPYLVPDTGQDESVRNPLLLGATDADTVHDGNTMLDWQRQGSSGTMTWAEADSYCRNLTLGGQTGWRLPNALELVSIVHYGNANPSIDQTIFTEVYPDSYWTSTTGIGVVNGLPDPDARAVHFAYGEVASLSQTATAHVLCTRGEELVSRLVQSGSGTESVQTDLSTGLAWTTTSLNTSGEICNQDNVCHPVTWDDAQTMCGTLQYAELGGLTPSDKPDAQGALSQAYLFSYGVVSAVPKADFATYGLRCVRGGNTTAIRSLGDVGNVAVMEVVGDFDVASILTRQEIAQHYLAAHGDTYDFLVFLSTFDYAMLEAGDKGYYHPVKNDTAGINQPIFDNSAPYGSNGKLQGTIDLGNVTQLASSPYGPKLDETIATLNHELMHRWGSYVRFKNPDGTLNTDLLGKDSFHWSYPLDTQGSLMYGNGWRDNGNGTFTATAAMSGYSPLDLYLMGMIPKEQVLPMLLIDNPAIDKTQLPQLGASVTGTAKSVTIDDIIAAEGARVPDAATSPKGFNVGFVLVTRPGVSTGNASQAIEVLRSAWAGRFAELTRGVGGVSAVTPGLTLIMDTPADNATIIGPDVTVTGTVINSSGVETGVVVNGMPATVSGSRFIANHVSLQEGANTLTVTATDANGLTATATRSVTAQAGHYLRVYSNVDSGTGPLDIAIRLDGSFIIANPTVSIAGPVATTLTPGESPTEFTARLIAEGQYVITASAMGPDGQTYSDSVTVTVVSKQFVDTLLQGKWSGMKNAMIASDIEKALSFVSEGSNTKYQLVFQALLTRLPEIAVGMRPIGHNYVRQDRAEYQIIRNELVNGQLADITYFIYFSKDENGLWKIDAM